ncbi:hypothetical protein M422DRAFT_266084 [Sphaerobolus stellatus SS14]|uniref:Uncharacterized protein n=2 Tax=Sphaerobolus stellatus (strain SS14) TaxID=990650 RepID=A0A0C9V3Y5_SPHS4|nr:hypothetical protein M422DRAFT_266084 [Sphaerobolus stellatus SS14]
MPLHNVTVEDSSPIVVYRNYSQWIDSLNNAPDYSQYSGPSKGFNSNHNTSEVATVDFAFNGSAIYVFGSTGPNHGAFTASLIPNNNFAPVADYSLAPANSIENTTSTSFSNETKYKQVLFSQTGLDQSVPHLLSLTNSGEGLFILDYFIVETDYQGTGSSIAEYILDDTNLRFSYNGNWTSDNAGEKSEAELEFQDLFYNKTGHFTGVKGGNTVFRFNGSGVAVHGLWSYGAFIATLDDQEPVPINNTNRPLGAIYNRPGELIYYAENLGEKEHMLTLVNQQPMQFGGLDIDYAVITTTNLDSVPKGINITSSNSPSGSTTGSNGNSTVTTHNNGSLSNNHGAAAGSMIALLFMFFQILHLLPSRR